MNEQQLAATIEAARERKGWYAEGNIICEPYEDDNGVTRNHTIAICKRLEQDFIVLTPDAIVTLAERVAALGATQQWHTVSGTLPPIGGTLVMLWDDGYLIVEPVKAWRWVRVEGSGKLERTEVLGWQMPNEGKYYREAKTTDLWCYLPSNPTIGEVNHA